MICLMKHDDSLICLANGRVIALKENTLSFYRSAYRHSYIIKQPTWLFITTATFNAWFLEASNDPPDEELIL